MKTLTLLICLFYLPSLNKHEDPNAKILGFWMSENNDLKVQLYEENNEVKGKLVWFACVHEIKQPMEDHKDFHNPDPNLRSRSWLNMIILTGLQFKENNIWGNGDIYDANSGNTYSATVTLVNDNQINVRGYWGFEIFGKTMVFYRVKE